MGSCFRIIINLVYDYEIINAILPLPPIERVLSATPPSAIRTLRPKVLIARTPLM